MEWTKKGLIYVPNKRFQWNKSHAQVPVVDLLNERVWRIYYASRNLSNQSQTSFIDVEAGNPANILYESSDPILPLGSLGAFDDSGIMPSSIVTCDGLKYLYFVGWTQRASVPYHNSIGLAISRDGGNSYTKEFEGPVIATSHLEPYFTGTCYVMKEMGTWKAWYLSCTKWEVINNKPEPYYHIKYAESNDGILWNRRGVIAIDYRTMDEGGIVSASVIRGKDDYKMWYAYRKADGYRVDRRSSYKIGYAESNDGIVWERKDNESGITTSESGWDSEMIAYPNVVEYKNRRFMFYNGNGFGATGIGYAIQNTV